MNLRKLIRVLHRDIGYVAVALTIIFSISGIAVNHIDDWNPNYIVVTDSVKIKPIIDSVLTANDAKIYVLSQLNITDSVKSTFRKSPIEIDIFLERKTISANIETGNVTIESVKNREAFKMMNFLHLNNPKRIWTWVSDIFAASLILLALTGMFILNGKNGFSGRGQWFFLHGLLVPVVFLFLYY